MTRAEIFENRRDISKKIYEQIRENGGRMLRAKYFPERPYCEGKKNYKFSAANYLRLMSSENKIIQNRDPRWVQIDDIKNNSWTLKENAESELLEVWEKSSNGEHECFLIEFYNAADILEKETLQIENQSLEDVIGFLQEREILEENDEIISFQDGIGSVKKYAEENGAEELTKILTAQMFLVESKVKTKIESYLPTYSDDILSELKENPDKIFESANKAQSILKKLRHKKIKPLAEKSTIGEIFVGLKIIYHGSEYELKNKFGSTYPNELILTGEAAYEFLFMLKSAEKQKIWLEFSYKGYAHGKFLIKGEDYENLKDESIYEFLKTRLNKNRKLLLHNPQGLEKYVTEGKRIRVEDLLNQIKLESEKFQSIMKEFEQEENKYLEQHSELLQS